MTQNAISSKTSTQSEACQSLKLPSASELEHSLSPVISRFLELLNELGVGKTTWASKPINFSISINDWSLAGILTLSHQKPVSVAHCSTNTESQEGGK